MALTNIDGGFNPTSAWLAAPAPKQTSSGATIQSLLNGPFGAALQGGSSVPFTTGQKATTTPNYPAPTNNVNQNNPYTVSGSTGGSSNLYYDPTMAAIYESQAQQLQNQAGQLDTQQGIGLDNIANSYTTATNRLKEQSAAAQRNYDLSKTQNLQNYAGAQNNANEQTRQTNRSLQQLLGLNGAGNSSAAYEAAPYAAALEGSKLSKGAQTTYGQNEQNLDVNWGDTQRTAKERQQDLDAQKYQQDHALRSSIASTRANLLDQIANSNVYAKLARGESAGSAVASRAPYQSQINDLLNQVTQLGKQYENPVISTGDLAYSAPALSSYSLSQIAAPNQAGGAQDVAPNFLPVLAGQKRDQFGNVIQ